jgi:hypothetical protein
LLVIEKQRLFDDAIGFHFDPPREINEASDLEECARRTNVTEHFAMSAGRLALTRDVCKHDAGSNGLGHRRACLRDRLFNEFETINKALDPCLDLPMIFADPPTAAIGAVPATAISCLSLHCRHEQRGAFRQERLVEGAQPVAVLRRASR